MEPREDNQSFLKTNVYSQFGEFFVSTIYRKSSSFDGGWFYETFGWQTDADGERHIIADNSGATFERKAINQHAEVIHQLIETGKFELPEV